MRQTSVTFADGPHNKKNLSCYTYHISADRFEMSATVASSPNDSLISPCLAMKKQMYELLNRLGA